MIQMIVLGPAPSGKGGVFEESRTELSPRDAITRIFRAYDSGAGPEFQVGETGRGEPFLRMIEFPKIGNVEQVFFAGLAEEMEILFRAADRLATAKSGDRTRIAMMLREGVTLSADIDRGLELTISELGLALESHRRSEMEFGRIVDTVRAGFKK